MFSSERYAFTDKMGFHKLFIYVDPKNNIIRLSHHSTTDMFDLSPEEAQWLRARLDYILSTYNNKRVLKCPSDSK